MSFSVLFVVRIYRFYLVLFFIFIHEFHVLSCIHCIHYIHRTCIFNSCQVVSTLFPHLFPLMCIHVVSYKHGGVPLGQCHSSMGEGVVCTP